MEDKNSLNAQEKKKLIKKNMLALYEGYQKKDKNPVEEVSYYNQMTFRTPNSDIMYGEQDIYQVKLVDEREKEKSMIVLYKGGQEIATVDIGSNIVFSQEYLENIGKIDPNIYALVQSLNGQRFDLVKAGKIDEKMPEISKTNRVENFSLKREELEAERKNPTIDKNINDMEKPKNEEESMEQISQNSGLTIDDIKSCSTIDPQEKITDQKSFEDIAMVQGQYSKIFVVAANSHTQGNSTFSFWGMKSDGSVEQVHGLEERQGVNTGKTIARINRDGSEVREEQTNAVFTMPNGREGFSITVGQYGMVEATYIRRSPTENKFIGCDINTSTQKPTTREVQEFMNDTRTTDQDLDKTIKRTEHQFGETDETKLRNIDNNPDNDVTYDADQNITLHDGTVTTLAKEAEKLGISLDDYQKEFEETRGDCPSEKIETIREEKALEDHAEQEKHEDEQEHDEDKVIEERTLENEALERLRKRGIID